MSLRRSHVRRRRDPSLPERRKGRRHDIFDSAAIVIGILLMCAMFLWVHAQGNRLDHQQKTIRRLTTRLQSTSNSLGADHLFLVESCNRLQIVRVEDNVSHFADFKVYQANLKVFRVVYEEGKVLEAFRMLTGVRGPSVLTPSFFARLGQAITSTQQAIRTKSWVPITDCRQAVNTKGVRYQPPRPVPFVKRLPTKVDLTLPPRDFR